MWKVEWLYAKGGTHDLLNQFLNRPFLINFKKNLNERLKKWSSMSWIYFFVKITVIA